MSEQFRTSDERLSVSKVVSVLVMIVAGVVLKMPDLLLFLSGYVVANLIQCMRHRATHKHLSAIRRIAEGRSRTPHREYPQT